ncbi:MAG: glycosyltransferase family 39 protein [Candidatus Gottesmanbacteria bacterium]|nr:glycosyltransferase family 39 protein [Candidatus Gottesmanbacteria bacterium]
MIPVIIIATLVAFGIAKLYIPAAIVIWDESAYIHWAYRVYHALKVGDFTNLWQITRLQFLYSPLTSWTIGAPLVPFGFSVYSARIAGLVWFIVCSALVYGIGHMFDRRKSRTVGTISSLLFITSPLMILYAGVAMREMPGAALTLAVLYFYFVARKTDSVISWFTSACFLIALSFERYNYGVLVAAAILLEAGIHIWKSKRRIETVIRYVFLFAPTALTMSWWVFTPTNRLYEFLAVLKNVAWVLPGDTNTWGHIFFYPYEILVMSGPSVLIGALVLVSIVFAIFHLRDYRIRMLWILFMLNLVIAEIHTTNMEERFLVTSLPALFIMSAYIAVDAYTSLKKSLKNKVFVCILYGILLLVGGKVAYDVYYLPQFVYSVGSFVGKTAFFNQKTIPDRYYEYDESTWVKKTWPDVMHERPQDVVTYVISQVDLGKPVDVVGRANELAPDYFTFLFDLSRDNGTYPRLSNPSYTVTVEVLPNSMYYTKDFLSFNAFIVPVIRQVAEDPSLVLLSSKDFKELGVSVHIYVPRSRE